MTIMSGKSLKSGAALLFKIKFSFGALMYKAPLFKIELVTPLNMSMYFYRTVALNATSFCNLHI